MESKPKNRRVRKARSATQEQQKREAQPKSQEQLIFYNADLVEKLYESTVWKEILFPLISEGIASVCGRYTNGRYYHGDLTRELIDRGNFLSGYQKALMDLSNRINDFIIAKEKLKEKIDKDIKNEEAKVYNPFLEEIYEEENS